MNDNLFTMGTNYLKSNALVDHPQRLVPEAGKVRFPVAPIQERPIPLSVVSERNKLLRDKTKGVPEDIMEIMYSDRDTQVSIFSMKRAQALEILKEMYRLPEPVMMDSGLTSEQILSGCGRDLPFNVRVKAVRMVVDTGRKESIFLPFEDQPKMPAVTRTRDPLTGADVEMDNWIMSPESWKYIFDLHNQKRAGFINFSAVMNLEHDMMNDMNILKNIMSEGNPFDKDVIVMPLIPNGKDQRYPVNFYSLLVMKKVTGVPDVSHDIIYINPDMCTDKWLEQHSHKCGSMFRLIGDLKMAVARIREIAKNFPSTTINGIRVKVLFRPKELAKGKGNGSLFGGNDGIMTLYSALSVLYKDMPMACLLNMEAMRWQRFQLLTLGSCIIFPPPQIRAVTGTQRAAVYINDAILFFTDFVVPKMPVMETQRSIVTNIRNFLKQDKFQKQGAFRETTIYRDQYTLYESTEREQALSEEEKRVKINNNGKGYRKVIPIRVPVQEMPDIIVEPEPGQVVNVLTALLTHSVPAHVMSNEMAVIASQTAANPSSQRTHLHQDMKDATVKAVAQKAEEKIPDASGAIWTLTKEDMQFVRNIVDEVLYDRHPVDDIVSQEIQQLVNRNTDSLIADPSGGSLIPVPDELVEKLSQRSQNK